MTVEKRLLFFTRGKDDLTIELNTSAKSQVSKDLIPELIDWLESHGLKQEADMPLLSRQERNGK